MFRFPKLVVAVLAWGALAFGAVYDWAYVPLLIVCAMLGLVGLLARRSRVQASVGWPLILALLATVLVVSLQLVPLPQAILQRISPATDTLLRSYSFAYAQGIADATFAAHPVSIAPSLTFVSLAFFLGLSLLLVGSVRILSRQDFLTIVHGIIVIGVVLAFAGMMQRASFNGKIYGFWQPRYVSSPFGPFVNYNHFAGWMLMAVPLAIGCLCARLRRATRNVGPTWRDRLVWLASPKANQAILIGAASVLMTLSMFLTMSRSGMTGFALAAAIMGWVMLRNHVVPSHRIAATAYLVLLALLSIGWTGASAVFDRFSAIQGSNLGNRFGVWQDTVGVIKDFPITGTGLNTFGVSMFFYQKHDAMSRLLQAHNDYLQLLSEGGLLLAIPVLVTIGLFARAVWLRFHEPSPDPTMYWLRVGAVTGLAAIGLQETVDFSLQIPGNAVLFTVLCAIALGVAVTTTGSSWRQVDQGIARRDGVAAPFAPATRPDARIDRLFAKYYYGRPDFIDGTALFHRLCRQSIAEGAAILEIGAGPSNATSACLATIGPVAGLDVSDEVRMNSHLMSTHVFDGHAFPFEAESFDACVSNYVLEHVAHPAQHFAEVARVLKPGGVYCFRTPNIWHYIVLASRCVPHAVHDALANRMRALVDAHDPYPTFYRANTRRTIEQLARSAGLATVALPTVEAEPWYGRSHALLFYPMMAYERLVNGSALLAGLRANIFGVLRKLAD